MRPARLDSGQTVEARTAPKSLVHMAKKLRAWAISRKPYGIGSSARRIRLTNRRRIKVKIPTSCRVQACRKDTNHFLQTFPRSHPEPVSDIHFTTATRVFWSSVYLCRSIAGLMNSHPHGFGLMNPFRHRTRDLCPHTLGLQILR